VKIKNKIFEMERQESLKRKDTVNVNKTDAEFEVEHVYGYRVHDCQQNL